MLTGKMNIQFIFTVVRGMTFLFRRRIMVPLLMAAFVASVTSVVAQETPFDTAPPPLKILSKSEKAQLAEKQELKDHTSLALSLMESRLKSAEKYRLDENYSLMYAELGGFHALMDTTLGFLLRSTTQGGKALNSLKKFEIGLRAYMPRIETLRREAPSNFEPYLKNLLKYISETREKAIMPFFDDNVVPNERN